MNTPYQIVIDQGEWLNANFPAYREKYPRHAYEMITPVFNKTFGTNYTPTQVYNRKRSYKGKSNYKYSKYNNYYKKEDLDSFYNFIIKQEMISKETWENKWFEITGKKLSYNSITQRLFQYGYRWKQKSKTITRSTARHKRNVGDIIVRNLGNSKVKWIKIKDFTELNETERAIHIKYINCLECDPCWQRHDKYVMLQNGYKLKDNDHIVHLNGDTLDDSIGNLYITDNYWEYNALKVKGLCELPTLVKAQLETNNLFRKVKELEND